MTNPGDFFINTEDATEVTRIIADKLQECWPNVTFLSAIVMGEAIEHALTSAGWLP